MFESTLETSLEEYSCGLACFVSLARDLGHPELTQKLLLQLWGHDNPAWKEKPSALTGDNLVTIFETILGAKVCTWTRDKETVLRFWERPERIGAFVVTRMQFVGGGTVYHPHCFRLLDCNPEGMTVMFPKMEKDGGAEIVQATWDFPANHDSHFFLAQ